MNKELIDQLNCYSYYDLSGVKAKPICKIFSKTILSADVTFKEATGENPTQSHIVCTIETPAGEPKTTADDIRDALK